MSFTYEEIDDEVSKKMTDKTLFSDFIWVTPNELAPHFPLKDYSPKPCCLPRQYKKFAEKIKNIEVFDDDVWLLSYPKSGTTWSQELVWLLKNDLDYEKASKSAVNDRVPFMDMEAIMEFPPNFPSIFEKALSGPRPRLIRTHLPIQLLPDQFWTVKPKMIYVFRNPKDVAVSNFHHYTNMHGYNEGMKYFVDATVKEFIMYSPFHEHISGFLQLAEVKENFLVTRYEDMKKDLPKEILKTAKFLGLDYTEKQILELAEHLSLENMKKNPSVNMDAEKDMILKLTNRPHVDKETLQFIRKGEVGGWKNELTPEMIEKMDNWTKEKIKNDQRLQKYFQ